MATINSTNVELEKEFSNLSVPTIICIEPAKEGYKKLLIAQKRTAAIDTSDFTNMALSTAKDRIARHFQTFSDERVKSMGLKPGTKFENWYISYVDVTTQPYPSARPKTRGKDGDELTCSGALVYETTCMTHGSVNDVKLAYDKQDVSFKTASRPKEFAQDPFNK